MARRILTLILLTATLVGVAIPASAKDEPSKTAKVKLETHKTPAVVEGGATWITVSWRGADADATGFRITATSKTPGIKISYPENTGAYSSLMHNDTLSSDEVDFTALRLDVPYDSKQIKLDVVASWNDGKKDVEKKFTVTVPTFAYTGNDAALVTTNAGVMTVDGPWVDVDWSGLAPALDGVQMTVDGPPDAVIAYPGGRAWSSLSFDDRLTQGETDVARFRLDASSLTPGDHQFTVLLTYTRGGSTSETSGLVTVTISG